MTDIAKLGFKVATDELRTAAERLDKVAESAGRAEQAKDKVERSSNRLRLGLLAAGGAIVGAASGLAALVASGGRAADEQAKLAQRLGLSVQALGGLQFAASQAGVSSEQLSAGVQSLTRQMLAARNGTGEVGAAFQRLGITVEDSSGRLRNTDEVMRDVADRLSKLPDGAEKSALAMQLLGRQGAALIPLLNGGAQGMAEAAAQAERLGLVMTATGAAAGERYANALGIVQSAAQGLRTQLWERLGPSVALIVERFAEFIEQSNIVRRVADFVSDTVRGLALVFQILVEAVRIAASTVAAFAQALGTSLTAAVNLARSQITALGDAFEGLANLSPSQIRAAFSQMGSNVSTAFNTMGEAVSRNLSLLRDEIDSSRERITALDAALSGGNARIIEQGIAARGTADALELVGDVTDDAAAASGRLADEAARSSDRLQIMARAAADLQGLTDRLAIQMGGPAVRAALEYRDAMARLAEIEQIMLEQGPLSEAQMQRLAALREQLARQLEDVVKAQESVGEAAGRAAGVFDGHWNSAIDRVSRAFGDWVTGSIRGTRDLGRAMMDILRQTLADIIAMFARQKIMLAFGMGGMGGAGSAMAGAMGGGGGGAGMLANLGPLLSNPATILAAVAAIGGAAIARRFGGNQTVGALFGGLTGVAVGGRSRVTGGSAGFSIGPMGGDAFRLEDRERRRSLFRGTRRWQDTLDPGDAARGAASDLFRRAVDAMAAAAAAAGAEMPPAITASFRQTFDAQGNVVSEIGTVAGREYRESADDFARRVVAESILAGLAAGFSDLPPAVERFRGDLDSLAEAAGALLMAADDIRQGRGLLDSLADIAGLLADLQAPGEGLTQTYVRLMASTALYEQALQVLGQTAQGSREEFVRLAAEIADAAGGVDAAAGLWGRFFQRFFEPEELVGRRLEAAQPIAAALLDAIGLAADIAAPDFRQAFEAALAGGLSAEATVAWLQAADALGLVLDLERELAALRGDASAGIAAEIAAIMQEVEAGLAGLGLSSFGRELSRIATDAARTVGRLQELGATEQQLMAARRLAQAQMLDAIAELEARAGQLVARLYGTALSRIEAQIAEFENSQVAGIDAVGQAASSMYSQQLQQIDGIRRYLDSMLLGPMSLLTPQERLAEAMRQYEQTLAAAQRGDSQALQQITGVADALIREQRAFGASSSPTQQLVDRIRADLTGLVGAGGTSQPVTVGDVAQAVTEIPAVLRELLAERERLIAEQEGRERLLLATELARTIGELSAVLGLTLEQVAERIGVELEALALDLGIDPEALADVIAGFDATQVAREQADRLASLGVTAEAQLGALGGVQSELAVVAEWTRAGVEAQARLDATIRAEEQATRNALAARLESVERAVEASAAGAQGSAAEIVAAIREAFSQVRT